MANKFKVVAFDLDGTLIDSIKVWLSLFKKTLKKFNIVVDEKDIENKFGKQYSEIIRLLAPKEKVEDIIKYVKQKRKNKLFLDEFRLFPFTKKVLENIQKKNIKLAIITGNDFEMSNFFMKKFQLDKLIDFFVCAEDVKKGKPDPEMLLKVLNFFRIKKEDLLYIGDGLYDIEMARKAGIKIGVVLTGVLDQKEAEKLKPDFIFDDVRGVLELV